MEKHGLLKCGWGINSHYWSQSYDSIVSKTGFSTSVILNDPTTNQKLSCPICKKQYISEVIEHLPGLEVKILTVRTFEGYYYTHNRDFDSTPKDSIRLELAAAGFKPIKDKTSDSIVYVSPEGYKAYFKYISTNKTQKLFLITPPKHELIKKIDTANKKDKRVKLAAMPKKPKKIVLTSFKDIVGNTVEVNDWVAYASFNDSSLKVGKIIRFTDRSASIKTPTGRTVSGKTKDQIVKLPDDQAMLLTLSS
jgi:hypothetical protein